MYSGPSNERRAAAIIEVRALTGFAVYGQVPCITSYPHRNQQSARVVSAQARESAGKSSMQLIHGGSAAVRFLDADAIRPWSELQVFHVMHVRRRTSEAELVGCSSHQRRFLCSSPSSAIAPARVFSSSTVSVLVLLYSLIILANPSF